MKGLGHIATGVISAVTAFMAVQGWQHYHPSQSIGKVNILGIVTDQQKILAAQLKPGMDEKAQSALIAQASQFGKQLDSALAKVATECNCTLINGAAIVRDAPAGVMPDYSARVAELTK